MPHGSPTAACVASRLRPAPPAMASSRVPPTYSAVRLIINGLLECVIRPRLAVAARTNRLSGSTPGQRMKPATCIHSLPAQLPGQASGKPPANASLRRLGTLSADTRNPLAGAADDDRPAPPACRATPGADTKERSRQRPPPADNLQGFSFPL